MFESTYMIKICSFVMDDQLQVDHEYYQVNDFIMMSVGENLVIVNCKKRNDNYL